MEIDKKHGDICVITLYTDHLKTLKKNIIDTIYKIERFYLHF